MGARKRTGVVRAIPIDRAAKLIGVSTTTVRRWIRSRHIRALRIGPWLVRIPVSEVNRVKSVRILIDETVAKMEMPRV